MNIGNLRPLTPFGNPLGFMVARNGEAVIVSMLFDQRNPDGSNRAIHYPLPPPLAAQFATQIMGAAVDAGWTFGFNHAKKVLEGDPAAILKLTREEQRIAQATQERMNGKAGPARPAVEIVEGPAPIEDVDPKEAVTKPALPETEPAPEGDEDETVRATMAHMNRKEGDS